MAITTYAALKTAVGSWLARGDLTDYTGDFVAFAEGHLNRGLRHRRMVTTVDLTPVSNVCTLPTDYLHYIRVVEKGSTRRRLKYIEDAAADELYPSQPAGVPVHFTIIGGELKAFPLSTNDIELVYRQKLPALTDSNTSNWLLEDCPEVYLRAAQLMALEFINETESPRYRNTAVLAQKLIDDLNQESMLGERYQAGVTIPGCTP